MRNLLALLLVLMVTACASRHGFDRETLQCKIFDQKQVAEDNIPSGLELKPRLPSPFKLAIYFTSSSTNRRYGSTWRWLDEDKDTFLAIGAELISKGIISDAFVFSDHIAEGGDIKAIRIAAARAGADAVLIVNGVGDIDRYNNALGYYYILLITPLFIPGTQADGLFLVTASLWDVRNQYLYLSVEGEGSAKEIKPVLYIDEKKILKSAKSAALAAMKTELSSRLAKIGAK
ncbi:MAG: hypothetical protein P4L44_16775 [Oryzomonas sp.]|uniref:hypothetical protein n=1 Tax=Oryzomonas sp. TaxID=2855186 RepID=UPI0028406559|nr:hypothetical protein [Oryzomonas sp.]MDR3581617.1 hypothetical protein [Oryzomonas sp.]